MPCSGGNASYEKNDVWQEEEYTQLQSTKQAQMQVRSPIRGPSDIDCHDAVIVVVLGTGVLVLSKANF